MNRFSRFMAWYRRPNKSTLAQWVETIVIVVPLAFIIRTYFYGLYQVPTGSMETTMLVGERFFADKLSIYFRAPKYGDIISFNDPNFAYSEQSFRRWFQKYVWGPSNWTKRVIGVPGDHIVGRIEEGMPVVYRNGEKVDEPYLNQFPIVGVYDAQHRPYPWVMKSYDSSYSYENQPFYIMHASDVQRAKRYMATYGCPWSLEPHTPALRDGCTGQSIDQYDIKLGENEYWVMGDNRQGSYDCRSWAKGGRPLSGELIHGKIIFRLFSYDGGDSWLLLDLIKHPIEFWRRIRWSRCLNIMR